MDIELDSDEITEEILSLLKNANEDSSELPQLEKYLKAIKRECTKQDFEIFDLEILIDCEDEISEMINDAPFRSDYVGPGASKNADLLEFILKYLTPLNENIEIVIATNPYINTITLNKLIKSEFEWEEDSTTQTLARVSKDETILERLAKSHQNSTRYEVAANINTNAGTLDKLSSEIDISDTLWYCKNDFEKCFIRYAVLHNPNTSLKTLEKIANRRNDVTEKAFVEVHGWSLFNQEDADKLLNEPFAELAKKRIHDSK